jgi:hypothetical protein
VWGIAWPIALVLATAIAAAVGGRTTGIIAAALILAAWPLQAMRIAVRTMRRGSPIGFSIGYGFLLMLAKWAQLIGQFRYITDRRRGQNTRLIEHKAPAMAGGGR